MSATVWDTSDLFRAASIPNYAAIGFVQERMNQPKTPVDVWLFELLLSRDLQGKCFKRCKETV